MKYVSIFSVTLKSAMTPSFMGLMATTLLGRTPGNDNHISAGLVDGHDRGLVDDNALAVREHQRVRGAQIDREVGGKQAEDRPQVVTVLIHSPHPPAEKDSPLPGRQQC